MTVKMSPSVHAVSTPLVGRGRWFAAAAFLVGALLQLAEFLLEPESDNATARIGWWLAHPGRMDASQAVGILAIPFLLVGAVMMWRLARVDSPKVASTALIAIAVAMVGLGLVHGIELAARWVAIDGDTGAAKVILDATDPRLPGILAFVMFLPMAVLGNLLMAVAQWRARFVPRALAVGLVAFVVLDFAADLGLVSHVVIVLVGVVLAWSIVTGYERNTSVRAQSAAD